MSAVFHFLYQIPSYPSLSSVCCGFFFAIVIVVVRCIFHDESLAWFACYFGTCVVFFFLFFISNNEVDGVSFNNIATNGRVKFIVWLFSFIPPFIASFGVFCYFLCFIILSFSYSVRMEWFWVDFFFFIYSHFIYFLHSIVIFLHAVASFTLFSFRLVYCQFEMSTQSYKLLLL